MALFGATYNCKESLAKKRREKTMFGKNAKQSKSSKCSKTAKSNVEASKEAKGCDSRTTKNSSR